MVTPSEIENKEFSKSMRGYNAEEVDLFLDKIILDLQALLDENEKLKKNVETLQKDLDQYKRSETSMISTLESAKKLMNDISESAEKRAEIIIKNAQMDAEVMQRDTKESIAKLTEEERRLRDRLNRFRERYRQMLESELDELDGSSEELLAELEKDFMPASMDVSGAEAVKASKSEAAKNTEALPKKQEAVKQEPQQHHHLKDETLIIDDNAFEEMLLKDFGLGSASKKGQTIVASKEDLTKTRVR